MIINNNLLGNTALNSLKSLGRGQQKSSEKLSTGSRITKASHDASGLAISNKMQAQIRGLAQAERNIEDGKSMLETMDSGMSTISDIINRQRELTIQAMNDSNTAEDREKIQGEINQLLDGIDDISNNTEFNTNNLLKTFETRVAYTGDKSIIDNNSNRLNIGDFKVGSGFEVIVEYYNINPPTANPNFHIDSGDSTVHKHLYLILVYKISFPKKLSYNS